ncbi:MAG: ATP synthase F0 subunit B [Nitrospinae bacterium]|nr:ATP synthase F0 subunit B [Nitrospinota bacterium]
MQDARCKMQDARCKMQDARGLASGFLFLASVFLLLTSCFLLLASVSYASGGGGMHHATEFKPVAELLRIINFLIVFGTLYFLLSKYVKAFFSDRMENIVKILKEAEELKSSVEKRLSEWEQKTKDMQGVILRMTGDAKREGEFIKNNIIRSAKDTSAKILGRAEREIEYETKRAKDRLRQSAAELTMRTAEDILKKGVTKDDHAVFVKEYIGKMTNNQITISR